MPRSTIPFANQRIIFFALLMGMTLYAIVGAVAIEMNDGKGLAEQPIEFLETLVWPVAGALLVASLLARSIMMRHADQLDGDDRYRMKFQARFVSLTVLEGGMFLSLTVWLLNARAVPAMVAAMVLFAVAIAITPLRDPDAEA